MLEKLSLFSHIGIYVPFGYRVHARWIKFCSCDVLACALDTLIERYLRTWALLCNDLFVCWSWIFGWNWFVGSSVQINYITVARCIGIHIWISGIYIPYSPLCATVFIYATLFHICISDSANWLHVKVLVLCPFSLQSRHQRYLDRRFIIVSWRSTLVRWVTLYNACFSFIFLYITSIIIKNYIGHSQSEEFETAFQTEYNS